MIAAYRYGSIFEAKIARPALGNNVKETMYFFASDLQDAMSMAVEHLDDEHGDYLLGVTFLLPDAVMRE